MIKNKDFLPHTSYLIPIPDTSYLIPLSHTFHLIPHTKQNHYTQMACISYFRLSPTRAEMRLEQIYYLIVNSKKKEPQWK